METPDEDEIVELLQGSDVFVTVPERDLRALAAGFAPRNFAPGEVAVEEGERGNEIFIVLNGLFEVYSSDSGESKGRKVLATLGRGELFGEIAALTGGRRYASVMASTAAVALVNGQSSFHEVLRSSRALSEAICRSLERYA